MTPLNPQRLFSFLESDPVFQRSQLAKEVSAQLLEELRDSFCENVCSTVQVEVRELLPKLVVESLAPEIRQLVRKSFGEVLRELREEFNEDPADWWKGNEE